MSVSNEHTSSKIVLNTSLNLPRATLSFPSTGSYANIQAQAPWRNDTTLKIANGPGAALKHTTLTWVVSHIKRLFITHRKDAAGEIKPMDASLKKHIGLTCALPSRLDQAKKLTTEIIIIRDHQYVEIGNRLEYKKLSLEDLSVIENMILECKENPDHESRAILIALERAVKEQDTEPLDHETRNKLSQISYLLVEALKSDLIDVRKALEEKMKEKKERGLWTNPPYLRP